LQGGCFVASDRNDGNVALPVSSHILTVRT